MSNVHLYKVTFSAEIVSGSQLSEVKEKLAQLFKSSSETIDKLFSGRIVNLKKGLTKNQALNYQQVLLKAGAVAHIHPIQVTVAPEGDLVAPPTIMSTEEVLSPPPPAAVTHAADPLGIAPAEQWQMDSVGVQMSKPKKAFSRSLPVTDYLELSAPRTEVGQTRPESKILAPDISHLDMADTGSRLSALTTNETLSAPDISHLDMAEVGESMGQSVQEQALITPDISEYSLTETQGEIEQLKHDKKPVNPDISHLNLSSD